MSYTAGELIGLIDDAAGKHDGSSEEIVANWAEWRKRWNIEEDAMIEAANILTSIFALATLEEKPTMQEALTATYLSGFDHGLVVAADVLDKQNNEAEPSVA